MRSASEGDAKGKAALAEASLLMAAFFVGTDFVSVKYALEGIPPLVLVPMRCVVAGLLVLLLFGGGHGGPGRKDLPLMACLGLVGVALNQIGYTVGLSLTSGSSGSLIFATAPVWGLLLGNFLGLERGTWRGALGLGPWRGSPWSWAAAWAPRTRRWGATCWCA